MDDVLKRKERYIFRRADKSFFELACNESIICQTRDNIHILFGSEKRALTKHPIRGEKWFMGIKSHVSFLIYGHTV